MYMKFFINYSIYKGIETLTSVVVIRKLWGKEKYNVNYR